MDQFDDNNTEMTAKQKLMNALQQLMLEGNMMTGGGTGLSAKPESPQPKFN